MVVLPSIIAGAQAHFLARCALRAFKAFVYVYTVSWTEQPTVAFCSSYAARTRDATASHSSSMGGPT